MKAAHIDKAADGTEEYAHKVQKRFLFRIPEDNLLSLVSPYTRSCVRIFRIPPTSLANEVGGHKSARYFLASDIQMDRLVFRTRILLDADLLLEGEPEALGGH